MGRLRAPELLDLWERAVDGAPLARALALLGDDRAAVAGLTVGERDRRLFAMRARSFGTSVTALASCAGCGQEIELCFDLDALATGPAAEPDQGFSVSAGGLDVRFRLPTSDDVLAALTAGGTDRARWRLFESCVLSVDGRPLSGDLAAAVMDAVAERMTELDPHAEVRLTTRCHDCGRDGEVLFDIGSFFWEELDAWAQRIAHQVDALARAYGWREADILAMSPQRRGLYLDLAGP